MTTSAPLELVLPAVPASVRKARVAAGDLVDELASGARLVDDVRLCVSEAVTNAIRHGYAGASRGDVSVSVRRDGAVLEVVVRDAGRGMARTRRSRAGGFGLTIIEKLTSELTISSSPSTGTEVRMVFAVPA